VSSNPAILLLNSDRAETKLLEDILGGRADVKTAHDLVELSPLLAASSYNVVFCGWSFQQGNWEDALGQVRQHSPDLPVIICRPTGTEREWVEVLEAGAFDLLIAPYQKETVLATLEQAVASYETRRLNNGCAPMTKTS
jgi:DNA-binding NtrC family response regulator